MTYKSYIEASLSKFNLSETEIELIMVENSIIPTEDVDVVIAKKAIHKSLSVWFPIRSNISEGGVSESWNLEAVKIYYGALCIDLGLENVINSQSSIRDKSHIW